MPGAAVLCTIVLPDGAKEGPAELEKLRVAVRDHDTIVCVFASDVRRRFKMADAVAGGSGVEIVDVVVSCELVPLLPFREHL